MSRRSLRSSILGERKSKTKKGWGGSWRDRHDISKAAATPVLLCAASYEDLRPEKIKENGGDVPQRHYHTHPSHTYKDNNMFRKGRCSEGWEESQDTDCLGCHEKAHGDKRVGFKKAVYSLNILHLALYEKSALKDRKTGKPVLFKEDGENHKRGDPILAWQEITRAKSMKNALANLEDGLEDKTLAMFRKKYLEVGPSHLDDLMLIADYAAKHCKCGGSLTPHSFSCGKCEGHLCSVDDDDNDMSPEDILQFGEDRHRCDDCGFFGFATIESICDECGEDADPLTAFDVVAYVRKTGEGTNSHITIEKIVPLYEFELPDETYLLEWDDKEDDFAIDDEGDFVFREDVAKLVNNQFDFDKVHRPFDNEYIAKLLRCENPFEATSKRSKYAKTKKRFNEGNNSEEEDVDDDDSVEEEAPKKKRRGRRAPSRRNR